MLRDVTPSTPSAPDRGSAPSWLPIVGSALVVALLVGLVVVSYLLR